MWWKPTSKIYPFKRTKSRPRILKAVVHHVTKLKNLVQNQCISHTVCHLTFDFSASNLATSFRSWTDTSNFHIQSKTMPMRRIARVTPTTIIGIFGCCAQSVETKAVMRVDNQSINFRQLKAAKRCDEILICHELGKCFSSSSSYFSPASLLKGLWNQLKNIALKCFKNYLLTYSTALLPWQLAAAGCRHRFWREKSENWFRICFNIIIKNRVELTKLWVLQCYG